MPVHVEKRGGKFRLIEPSGRIAKTSTGKAADGGGHASKAKANRQASARNSGVSKGRKR